jgi:hypothetical protein
VRCSLREATFWRKASSAATGADALGRDVALDFGGTGIGSESWLAIAAAAAMAGG